MSYLLGIWVRLLAGVIDNPVLYSIETGSRPLMVLSFGYLVPFPGGKLDEPSTWPASPFSGAMPTCPSTSLWRGCWLRTGQQWGMVGYRVVLVSRAVNVTLGVWLAYCKQHFGNLGGSEHEAQNCYWVRTSTRPFRGSGGQSPASHRGGPCSITGQFLRDFWWTKGPWDRLFSQDFSSPLSVSFHRWSIPIHSPTSHNI